MRALSGARLPACARLRQVIDVADSRLAKTQRLALAAGRSTTLKWEYDDKDQLKGVVCDGVWFGREELMSLTTL